MKANVGGSDCPLLRVEAQEFTDCLLEGLFRSNPDANAVRPRNLVDQALQDACPLPVQLDEEKQHGRHWLCLLNGDLKRDDRRAVLAF